MHFDLMVGPSRWDGGRAGPLGRGGGVLRHVVHRDGPDPVDEHRRRGDGGAVAARLSTGIAVAFARSPIITASHGVGAGREHRRPVPPRARQPGQGARRAALRRRSSTRPGPRLRDYVLAVQACLRGVPPARSRWPTTGPTTAVLLPPTWAPRGPRVHGDSRSTCRRSARGCAGWRARWPTASTSTRCTRCPYLRNRLLPAVAEGAARAGRDPTDVDLLVPVFAVPGDTPEEQAPLLAARPHADRLLRVDAELRVPVRRPRLRGHLGAGSTSSSRPATWADGGHDHRRDARALRGGGPWDELADRSSTATAGSPPGWSCTSPSTTSPVTPTTSGSGQRSPLRSPLRSRTRRSAAGAGEALGRGRTRSCRIDRRTVKSYGVCGISPGTSIGELVPRTGAEPPDTLTS